MHRPHLHFTPPHGWLNDPNGLVYHAGEYHLFYQYHPASTVWGPMHWGHAVSPDLVRWRHLPIALAPDALGAIWSGSAVVDAPNTARFGAEALVAVFTHAYPEGQAQSLAYSTDHGRQWVKYPGNPVLTAPDGRKDFRDPKVFWHAASQGWVMALAAGHVIQFYTSPDLRRWSLSGEFGPGHGAAGGVWETPDLFPLTVGEGPDQRWVLTVGVWEGGPAGGSATQYFVGAFDGRTFTSENAPDTVLWMDHGADFYAPQSWFGAPAGRRVQVAWLNNWRYARDIPATEWRGAFTLPRELALTPTPAGPRLIQRPIPELHAQRGAPQRWPAAALGPDQPPLTAQTGPAFEVVAEFSGVTAPVELRLGVRMGAATQTVIGYQAETQRVYVDRTRSGAVDFHPDFAGRHTAEAPLEGGRLRLNVWVDHTSVEVFAQAGQTALTDLIFPELEAQGLSLSVSGGAVRVDRLEVYPLLPPAG